MQAVHGPRFLYAMLLMASGIFVVAAPTEAGSGPGDATKKASHSSANSSANSRANKSADKVRKKSKEDQAIDLVWRRPEVRSWLKLFPRGKSKLGGHAVASVDHNQGDVYSVHVYEDLPDHTATFNWYDVNLKTGKITKMF